MMTDKTKLESSSKFLSLVLRHAPDTAVDLALTPLAPPRYLYHGTASRFVDAISTGGLRAQSRNHVHLSSDRDTAVAVGTRHGKPVVLVVDAGAMHAGGHVFYLSENAV